MDRLIFKGLLSQKSSMIYSCPIYLLTDTEKDRQMGTQMGPILYPRPLTWERKITLELHYVVYWDSVRPRLGSVD